MICTKECLVTTSAQEGQAPEEDDSTTTLLVAFCKVKPGNPA